MSGRVAASQVSLSEVLEKLDAAELKKASLTISSLVSTFPKISDIIVAQAKQIWPATDDHLDLIKVAKEDEEVQLALALLILIAKLGEIAVSIHTEKMRK